MFSLALKPAELPALYLKRYDSEKTMIKFLRQGTMWLALGGVEFASS